MTSNDPCRISNDEILFSFQSVPQFLPVIRGTVSSLPANRDPEVLERLHPEHFKNMCNRMQVHLNASSSHVAKAQTVVGAKVKEVILFEI